MKVVPFTPENLKEAVALLKKGGVIAHPADTCYGLTADVMSEEAYKKIQAVKGRAFDKPMSIMISVAQQLQMRRFVELSDFAKFVAHKLFPGAITLVLPKGPDIPPHYFPNMETVGLRVPLHNATQDILAAFKGPLITTSANPSGDPLCFTHEEVVESFQDSPVKPDLVFEGKTDHFNLASTVLTIHDDHLRIVREGPVTAGQLESILGVPIKS